MKPEIWMFQLQLHNYYNWSIKLWNIGWYNIFVLLVFEIQIMTKLNITTKNKNFSYFMSVNYFCVTTDYRLETFNLYNSYYHFQ